MTDVNNSEWQYRRNPKTGEVHRVLVSDGATLSDERCQLDQADEVLAGETEVGTILAANPYRACGHCLADYRAGDTESKGEIA